jgi:hypothetical protein
MDLSRGAAVVLLGVVLFAGTMAVGAATAPSRDVGGARPTHSPTPTPGTPPGTATETSPRDVGDTATATRTLPARPQTLVGMQGGGAGWHKFGSVFLLSGSEEVWREASADSYFDVTMLPNGSVMAGFMHSGYEDCGPYESPCTKTGFRIIDPDAGGGPQVVSEYSFPVRSETNSEVHDVERLGPGRFLLTDMDRERIFEVTNGTVTWQWNASRLYDAPPDVTRRDWLHVNDVDVIGEGRYLVSVRNANQLVVVERGAGAVEVINADPGGDDASCTQRGQLDDFDGEDAGDVRCGDPAVLDHQHNPQWLGPGAVLVADSDNDRVVELHRTVEGDWEVAWRLASAGGIELDWPRDADRLPDGNTLVTDTLNRRVFEVTDSGEVVWSRPTERIPYEADRLPMGELAGAYGTSTPGETSTPPGGGGTATSSPDGRTATATGDSLPTGGDGGGGDGDGGDDVPGLSLALVGLRALFPKLPFWFGEFHLVVSAVATGLVVGGGIDHWRNGR